jgi:hypothetical protein
MISVDNSSSMEKVSSVYVHLRNDIILILNMKKADHQHSRKCYLDLFFV